MPGKQGGHDGRRLEPSREPPKQDQQQRAVGGVEQHIDEVMGAGVEAEALAVGHVGKPGERMPVGRVEGGERPFDARQRQSRLHHRVVGDIVIVVEIQKIVPGDRQIDQQCGQREQPRHGAGT